MVGRVVSEIIGFNGPPRSGKTAGLATIGLISCHKNRSVFSNFEIKHPLAKQVEPYDLLDFLEQGEEHAENSPLFQADLIFQEMQNWLESRLGQDKTQLCIGYFLVQAPKMGFNIYYDAQLNSSVDKRLKQNVSRRWEAERTKNGIRYWKLNIKHTEENIRSIPKSKKFVNNWYLQNYVFPYYNTHKVSVPIGFKTLKMQMEKDSPKHLKTTVRRQTDLILENKKYLLDNSIASVEYALTQLEEPIVFSKYVSVELKLRHKQHIQPKR